MFIVWTDSHQQDNNLNWSTLIFPLESFYVFLMHCNHFFLFFLTPLEVCTFLFSLIQQKVLPLFQEGRALTSVLIILSVTKMDRWKTLTDP